MRKSSLAVLAFFGLSMGCAGVSKERGHKEVAELVEQRTGYKTHWEQGPPTDSQIAGWVDGLLQGGLTRDRAVGIALVNSPSLQATYEELGVSQADMVQAGLLSNPRLGGSLGLPLNDANREYEVSLVQDFLDIFVLPLRKRVAREQFVADTLRVAHETLRVAGDVRKGVIALEASIQLVELRREIARAAQASAELAERLHEAGNITDLALAQEQTMAEQVRIDLSREELAVAGHREDINRLLGLWGTRTSWKLTESLPGLAVQDPSLEHLESRAIRQRLDIDAARKQTFVLWNALELAKNSRYFGFIEVGIHTHQDPDGARLLGPTLALELPIFDQRQALIARLEAQYRQATRRLAALSVNARSEVRVAAAQLGAARWTAERYQKVLLPLRERVVNQSQLEYNAMQIGLAELLLAKQSQIEAYRAYVEALRDYWDAHVDLELAIGGRVTEPPAPPGKDEMQ
jgi:cobalt-zinc-cadmium efflux system outer membrane protein